ncbi:ArnT family glycosyltransferase [Silvibacterium sp.]|uniref:ArnT family glycosyltransferase n=1 Tax=Silvibacterium sp. TaxID=1964179 RepID=UPI0039E55178
MKPEQTRSLRASSLRAPWALFWVGFLVRVLYITVAHTYRFPAYADHFKFGYEMGRVARALVTGFGYADPFNWHTGPTAWVPPAYPLLIAGAFKLFGVYSLFAGWVLLVINSLFNAAAAVWIYEIAARCFNRKVAVWSGWIWALYPTVMEYATRWVWETAISAALFTAVLLLALRMRGIGEASRREATLGQWLLFGLLWGVLALSNSTLLLFLPICGLWLLAGSAKLPQAIAKATAAGILCIAIIAPWIIRNERALHAFVPMRSNFGAELYAGNGPGSMGFRYGALIGLPEQEPQHKLYKQLGEIEYVREHGQLAKAYIAAHPGHFATLSLERFDFFWASVPHPTDKHWFLDFLRQLDYCLPSITGVLGLLLALKRRIPAAGLFAWAFALLPLTYYFVTVEARFRHPLEPLIVILSVYLFQSAERRRIPAARA